MQEVFLVSKPLGPPWNDSSRNLSRDLALCLRRYRPVAFGRLRSDFRLPNGRLVSVPGRRPRSFSLSLADRGIMLARLVADRRTAIHPYLLVPEGNQRVASGFGYLDVHIAAAR